MAEGGRFASLLRWGRERGRSALARKPSAAAAAEPSSAAQAAQATPAARGALASVEPAARAAERTFPRPARIAHHWLTVTVQRAGPAHETPIVGARVVVRAHPLGELRPGEPVARGITRADGTAAFLLPPGRYSVAARESGGVRAATVVLDRAGGVTLALEDLHQRVGLHVQVDRTDLGAVVRARVEVRSLPTERLVAEAVTDAHGVADFTLPPGAYEVRVGEAKARTFLEANTVLRLAADRARQPRRQPSAYSMQARQAVNYVQRFELGALRDDGWN